MLFSMRLMYMARQSVKFLAICLVLLLNMITFGLVGVHQAEAWVTIAQDNPSWNPQIGTYTTGIGGGSFNFSSSYNGTWGTMWGNIINNGVDIWVNPYFNIGGNSDTINGSLTVTVIGYYIDGSQVSRSYTYSLTNVSLPSEPSNSYGGPPPNGYIGQQLLSLPATNNSAYLGYWQLEASDSFSGELTATNVPYYQYVASISCYLNMGASYSEANNAADEQTAQTAASAAQGAQYAAQNAQSAAQNAASNAQNAYNAAQNAQNNTWYNSNSAGYWSYQAYQKAQIAASGQFSVQLTGVNGADAATPGLIGVDVVVSGGSGPYQYSVNGSGFAPLPSNKHIFISIGSGSNQEDISVKDSNGLIASSTIILWGIE